MEEPGTSPEIRDWKKNDNEWREDATFTKYSWQIGPNPNVQFHIAHGDLFQAPVDAIVNAEQTDFVCAHGNPKTISGQIAHMFGPQIQDELFQQTRRQILDVGTVLKTSGGNKYKAIYHAGFHHPDQWLSLDDDESNDTEHLQVIRSCVQKILNMVADDPHISSVAFPLIGSGNFTLNHTLVAHDFFQDVIQFADQIYPEQQQQQQQKQKQKGALDIWLIEYKASKFHSTLESGIQAWLSRTSSMLSFSSYAWEPYALGVPHLDLFESRMLLFETHPRYAAWVHVRFAELIVGYITAVLATQANVMPRDIVQRGRPISFGALRQCVSQLSQNKCKVEDLETSTSQWCSFLAMAVNEAMAHGLLQGINADRNHIAHGREARSVQEMRRDITRLVQLSTWKALSSIYKPPSAEELSPWLAVQQRPAIGAVATTTTNASSQADGKDVGVFEKWAVDSKSYTVPWSGTHFLVETKDSGV
jgi:O-acetyl-ADP-ribose deacetylase (regulator of RNase III)